jgi:hypothetical protein
MIFQESTNKKFFILNWSFSVNFTVFNILTTAVLLFFGGFHWNFLKNNAQLLIKICWPSLHRIKKKLTLVFLSEWRSGKIDVRN